MDSPGALFARLRHEGSGDENDKCGFSSNNPTTRCITDIILILLCKEEFLLINPEETKPFEDIRIQNTKNIFCFGFVQFKHSYTLFPRRNTLIPRETLHTFLQPIIGDCKR